MQRPTIVDENHFTWAQAVHVLQVARFDERIQGIEGTGLLRSQARNPRLLVSELNVFPQVVDVFFSVPLLQDWTQYGSGQSRSVVTRVEVYGLAQRLENVGQPSKTMEDVGQANQDEVTADRGLVDTGEREVVGDGGRSVRRIGVKVAALA
jgi:hypothetical protein